MHGHEVTQVHMHLPCIPHFHAHTWSHTCTHTCTHTCVMLVCSDSGRAVGRSARARGAKDASRSPSSLPPSHGACTCIALSRSHSHSLVCLSPCTCLSPSIPCTWRAELRPRAQAAVRQGLEDVLQEEVAPEGDEGTEGVEGARTKAQAQSSDAPRPGQRKGGMAGGFDATGAFLRGLLTAEKEPGPVK